MPAMTITLVKEKLHEYIDNADEKKLQAIFTLIESEIEDRSSLYDDASLSAFRETREEYLSGKTKGYSVQESIDRIRRKVDKK